ncbi:MAG: RNA-binding S4 domain-containing protein [Christensenella sp.]|uniref:RNA-binding S4 domain-containing protein n=1 Tax=Christensenella sp. TaxID=1935934 RepID=UPI002B20CE5F|nr:RNA-binding S4 domain-containing protein [Christensenella sp.]MEA5004143.1 RNA-binding S4 domain-containing protein [Christensenella sp.]
MRLDKYLKVSRLIKRRTVAQSACEGSRVLVNGKVQKSSYAVKLGDEITIEFGSKPLKVRVLAIVETTKKQEADGMYEVIE